MVGVVGVVDGWVGRRVSHTSPFNLTFSSSCLIISYCAVSQHIGHFNSHYKAHTTLPASSSLYNSLAFHTT